MRAPGPLRARFAWALGLALGCAPAQAERELASFQRALDRELATALVMRPGPGLDAGCHDAAILWMRLVDEGRSWRLTSVDAAGQVGVWSPSGLAQSWSLTAVELAWVRDVGLRQELSEDAEWLRARAKVPGPALRPWEMTHFLFEPGELPTAIAPRDHRRWLGVVGNDGDRLSASRRWYAVGDDAGNLEVARISGDGAASLWRAPGCAAVDD